MLKALILNKHFTVIQISCWETNDVFFQIRGIYHLEEGRQENHIEIRAFVTQEMNFHQKNRREFMRRRKRKGKIYKREF